MALSDEQNAMLRLLASGEQGYEDIAALMGLGVDEVRAKVVGALAQLQAEGKPAPRVPPPLQGGAQPAAEVTAPEPGPISAAPADEEPPAEPVMAEPTVPQAPPEPSKPKAPRAAAKSSAVPPKSAASPPPSSRTPSGNRTVTVPSGRKAWLLGGGVIGAIVVIVVVILLVSGGGNSSSGSTEKTGTTTPGKTTAAENGGSEGSEAKKEPTGAELKAVDGSAATGVVTFGRVKKKLALAIEATGLEPTTEGTDSYTVWLAQSPKKMLPLVVSIAVKSSGKTAGDIVAEYEAPVEVLGYLANGTFDQIAITRTQDSQLEAALKVATEEKTTPTYTGEPVLRGSITGPIVGIATREEEEKKEESE